MRSALSMKTFALPMILIAAWAAAVRQAELKEASTARVVRSRIS